jgi:hypothetical protein
MNMNLEPAIRKFLDISTSHITEKDGALLRNFEPDFKLLMTVENTDYASRVICADDPNSVHAIQTLRHMGFSINFIRILQEAHKMECYFVSFDGDGVIVPNLATFDW